MEALADFNKAIRLDPNYAQAYANRGLIYRQTGRLELALADYNKALSTRRRLCGRLSRPRHRLSAAAGSRSQAFADFNKAIGIRPDNAQAYYNRGLLYQGPAPHQFAIDDFTTAIGPRRSRAEPFIARGLSYMAIERLQGGSEPTSTTRCNSIRRTCRRGSAAGSPMSGSATRSSAAGSYARALNIKQGL